MGENSEITKKKDNQWDSQRMEDEGAFVLEFLLIDFFEKGAFCFGFLF